MFDERFGGGVTIESASMVLGQYKGKYVELKINGTSCIRVAYEGRACAWKGCICRAFSFGLDILGLGIAVQELFGYNVE